MFTQSLWNSFSQSTDFPTLDGELTVDVAIIGGGITGITTAQLLSQQGFSVAVLEARKIGGGTTSHSTGNLYYTIDKILSSLQSKYDNEVIRKVVSSRYEAIRLIEDNVTRHNLDCDFQKVPWYLYASNEENSEKIDKEYETAIEAGVQMIKADPAEIPFQSTNAVKVGGQAQFNSMRYVQGLSEKTDSINCRIFENTRVTNVKEEDGGVKVKTTGGNISAKYAVYATHTPKGVRLAYHTVLGPYREYGVAGRLNGQQAPKGIYWGYFGKGDKYSVRTYKRDGKEFIMAIGQPHKVGQAENNEEHIKKLEEFLGNHFDIGEITHRWGGQHYRPADNLPYIGRKSENSKIFLATGFSTDGLVYGTLSAMIISDEIAGKDNLYSEMYKASRFSPMKSAKEFLKENINMAGELIKGLAMGEDNEVIRNIQPGEGKIISQGKDKIAVSRDPSGKINAHSAVCTHLGCTIHRNIAEKTWDCPCHGSRFDENGEVLEGPALDPLKKIELGKSPENPKIG